MSAIVEVDEQGAIQLPADLVNALKPHTRFILEMQGTTLLLHPVSEAPFWQSATPEERVAALRRWAAQERPTAPVLSEMALRRGQMYD